MAEPSRYRDPITGEDRILAPRRARRPHRPTAGCPFCPGNEEETPAEVDRVAGPGGTWQARVVPNLYPLAPRHELVITTPRHVESVRDLDDDEWLASAELLLRRYRALLDGLSTNDVVCAFVNDGERAGASIPHAHIQVICLPESERSLRWLRGTEAVDACAVCAALADPQLLVEAVDDAVVCAHPAPRAAGALLAAPALHTANIHALTSGSLAGLLAGVVRHAPTDVDFNLIVYARGPGAGHLYVELLPRVGFLAGLELGMGIGVSTLDPTTIGS